MRFLDKLIVPLLVATPALAQQQVRIDAGKGPSCINCTIALTRVASLGKVSDPDSPNFAGTLALDRDGNFLVTASERRSILVYDPGGRLLRTVGRAGQGPGEFTSVSWIWRGAADSIFVLDFQQIEVFSPSFQYARTTPLMFPTSWPPLVFANGTVILPYTALSGPPRFPIHFLSASGVTVRTFGADRAGHDPMCMQCFIRPVSAGRTPGTFWSARRNLYAFELWDTAGRLVRNVTVNGSAWHTPWLTSPERATSPVRDRPLSRPDWVAEDAQGRLWVIGRMAADNWRPDSSARPASPAQGRASLPVNPAPHPGNITHQATIIEVLDPATGRVIVSRKFNAQVYQLLSPDYVYSIRENDDGIAVFDVWRMSMITR